MKYQKTTLSWDTLKEFVMNEPQKKYESISPSGLGGCMRSHYWKLMGIQSTTPPNPGALVNFKVGHHWESVLADAYESKGMLEKHFIDGVDKLYDKDSHLGGTPDLLVKVRNDEGLEELVIVDCKTVNSGYFRYAKLQSLDNWVKDNLGYVYQQGAYIYLARLAGYKVDKAILSFASKDDGYIGLEFMIEADDQLIQMVKDRALRLKGYLDRKELPPCDCKGWKVGYCDYGNPKSQEPNKKKKMVNTECCPDSLEKLDSWR
jgi:hypothetical protein